MITVKDTALILEGGSMRAAFSSAFVVKFIEENIYFPLVCGISAGSSLSASFLTRDPVRTKRCFVDIADEKKMKGMKYFLQGKGYFHSQYIYHDLSKPGALLEFEFSDVMESPGDFRIGAVEVDTGKLHYFSKKDVQSKTDLLTIIQASSSLPLVMPSTEFQGKHYVDGGVESGFALDAAKEAGYEKFFIILTQPRDFIKEPYKHQRLLKLLYRKNPKLLEKILTRQDRYNAIRKEIAQLETEGKAYVVYPEKSVDTGYSFTREALEKVFQMGKRQADKEIHAWKEFLLL